MLQKRQSVFGAFETDGGVKRRSDASMSHKQDFDWKVSEVNPWAALGESGRRKWTSKTFFPSPEAVQSRYSAAIISLNSL